jgi:hypothetical protein
VAEGGLHLVQWRTLVDGVRTVRVSQPMRGDRSIDASPCCRPLHHPVHRARGEPASFAASEHGVVRASVAAQREQRSTDDVRTLSSLDELVGAGDQRWR